MLKFGILDFDTSHAVEFTRRLNHRDIAEEQWVEGGKVVAGCPGESKLSPERIPGFTEAMKKLEVPLVDKPADLIGKVDVVLIEAVEMLKSSLGDEDPVARPAHWSGFRIVPVEIEFWQDGAFRLHDRVRFTRTAADAVWSRKRLYP